MLVAKCPLIFQELLLPALRGMRRLGTVNENALRGFVSLRFAAK